LTQPIDETKAKQRRHKHAEKAALDHVWMIAVVAVLFAPQVQTENIE